MALEQRWASAVEDARVNYQVFVSHSSIDTWVARQISTQIRRVGATSFLDEDDVEHGDNFDHKIREAASESQELLVLITPWSTSRPYIWLEIGAFWSSGKRIVGVLHGLTVNEVSSDPRIPAFLKQIDVVNLNDLDSYFEQLARRVTARRA